MVLCMEPVLNLCVSMCTGRDSWTTVLKGGSEIFFKMFSCFHIRQTSFQSFDFNAMTIDFSFAWVVLIFWRASSGIFANQMPFSAAAQGTCMGAGYVRRGRSFPICGLECHAGFV